MKIYCSRRSVCIDDLIGKDMWLRFKINYITPEFSWAKFVDRRYSDRFDCECYIFNLIDEGTLNKLLRMNVPTRKGFCKTVLQKTRIVPITEIDALISDGLADKDLMTTEELFGFDD